MISQPISAFNIIIWGKHNPMQRHSIDQSPSCGNTHNITKTLQNYTIHLHIISHQQHCFWT